jgi:hypothetical protein
LRFLTSFALLAAACGPVTASSVIDDAEAAAARAHASEGEKYAAYDTTLADLYLQKAREEQGHAHYGDAEELAEQSQKFARDASKKAAEKRASESAQPQVPHATVQRPAPVAPPPAPASEKKAPIPVPEELKPAPAPPKGKQ